MKNCFKKFIFILKFNSGKNFFYGTKRPKITNREIRRICRMYQNFETRMNNVLIYNFRRITVCIIIMNEVSFPFFLIFSLYQLLLSYAKHVLLNNQNQDQFFDVSRQLFGGISHLKNSQHIFIFSTFSSKSSVSRIHFLLC